MKLLKKAIDRDGTGEVSLMPELEEDMWHAYNLIAAGDQLRATTIRKVQREGVTGSVDSQKIKLTLCIEVLDVEFDTEACSMRVKGRNIEENKYVKRGQHHTIDMELNRKFTLIKQEWDSIALERIELACDVSKTADLAAVIMDEGRASLCLITGSMTLIKSRIEVTIPRKKPQNQSQRDKAMQRFYKQIADAIEKHVDFGVVKAIVVASPGFQKDDFLAFLFAEAVKKDNRALKDNKAKFIAVGSPSGHVHDLKEVLAEPSIAMKLSDTKAAAEVKALDSFYKMMGQDEDRAFYGFGHVRSACDAQAIDTLLLSDELFRSKSVAERKQYVKLVDDARDNGAAVHIFSSLHVSGQQLGKLSGVAAVLRYPMPEIAEDESDDESD